MRAAFVGLVRGLARRAAIAAIGLAVSALAPAPSFAQTATPPAPRAVSLDVAAPNAIVIDFETGATLLDVAADAPFPPASMSKLMTSLMVFEAVTDGRLALDDRLPVSEAAFRKEGSSMFLNLTDRPSVAELLRGVIVQSGNDACIVLAEAIAGSERAFAERMSARAIELGMTGSSFRNATGLPEEGHVMTARDLATLARHIIAAHPDFYAIYSERDFTWAGVTQPNRNPLLGLDIGADGMKTGHTEEAGYGLVGSATKDGRRVVAVVAGLPSERARALEGQKAVAWGLREFENVTLAKAGQVVGRAAVWIGAEATAPLALAQDLVVTRPRAGKQPEPTARIVYDGPAPAPIEAGRPLGVLVVEVPGLGPVEAPLVVAEAVALGGYSARVGAGLDLLLRWVDGRPLPGEALPTSDAAAAK